MQTGILVRANKPGVVSLDAEDRSTYQVGVENALKYVEFLVNQIRELGRVHSGVLEYLGQKGVLDDSSAYDNEKVIYSIPNSK
ncbi:MAG: hypothetical protein GW780_05255 [Candidatus Aenigmarchaeota archaeon]|nr:hypothetical protein [Candidatus Aenigmarchaeota archaeon]